MRKFWLLFAACWLIASTGLAQEGAPPGTPEFRSFLFDGKLDRTTPETALPPGSVKKALNVIRPAPGIAQGWKARSGASKHNTTAIGSGVTIDGIWSHVHPEHGTYSFLTQTGGQIYNATNDPPSTAGGSFGSSVYTMDSDAGAAFCDHINDDWVGAATGTSPWAWSGGTDWPRLFYVKHETGTTLYRDGTEDVTDDRLDTSVVLPEHSGSSEYFYFAHQRRLDGLYLDLLTGSTNILASGLTIQARRDGAWVGVSSLSDGTADPSGVTTLYESEGHIVWDRDTSDDPHLLPGTQEHFFWYRAGVTADVTDNIKAWRARVNDDCEDITNLWSGYWEVTTGALLSTTTGYANYTGEVTDGTDAEYINMAGIATTQELYVAFPFPVFAIYVYVDPEYRNEDGTPVLKDIEWWDGDDNTWTPVTGTTRDGTEGEDGSLHHSGAIQWDGEGIDEHGRYLGGDKLFPWYWYRLTWMGDIPSTNEIHVYEIAGAQKPDSVPPLPEYDGVIEHNSRAWGWPSENYRHGIDYAEEGKPWVWNGPQAGSTGNIFGPGVVNSMARLGSYAVVSTKEPYRLYLLQGKSPGKFDELLLSTQVGAVAPHSMATIEDAVKLFSRNVVVNAVTLMAPDGVYLTDGMRVISISQPIADYFDTSATPYIEPEYANEAYSWVDYQNKIVNFAVPLNMQNSDHTQTSLNYVLPYAYLNDEWYDRHEFNSDFACGMAIVGDNDQRLAYAGDYNGYVWRLNTGNSDNGNAVEHYIRTAQINMLDTINVRTRILQLRARYRAEDSGNIDPKIFPDGHEDGFSPSGVTNMSMENSGYDMTSGKVAFDDSQNLVGESCGFEFKAGVTDVETMEIHGFTVDYQRDRRTGGDH